MVNLGSKDGKHDFGLNTCINKVNYSFKKMTSTITCSETVLIKTFNQHSHKNPLKKIYITKKPYVFYFIIHKLSYPFLQMNSLLSQSLTLVTHSVCPVSVFTQVPAERDQTFTVKSAEPLTRVSSSSL